MSIAPGGWTILLSTGNQIVPSVAHRQSLFGLDALNFFLADVRDGLGPYLAIYLATALQWQPSRIGIAMATMGIATVIAQTPAGALVDATRRKRAVCATAAIAVAGGCLGMLWLPNFSAILVAQSVVGIAAAFFAPVVSAITLGIVGHAQLARRMGRNEAWNHSGNVVAAVLAGVIGQQIAYEGIFFLVAGMSLASVLSVLAIRPGDIDHELARGSMPHSSQKAERVRDLFRNRSVLAFSISVILFHLANAAMLPLVGQKLSAAHPESAAATMSACIVIAQLVMIPAALWASRAAETWGRKPVFLLGFAVLPVRGILYTLTDNPYALVAIQSLDGIGAGIFGVVGVLVIADLTMGTGRFNLMQGSLATALGIGAAASNVLSGLVVEAAGFNAGFTVLAATAAAATAFFAVLVPETKTIDARLDSDLPLQPSVETPS